MFPSFEVLIFSVCCVATFIFPEESEAIPQNKEKEGNLFLFKILLLYVFV